MLGISTGPRWGPRGCSAGWAPVKTLSSISSALLGILYEDKERQDFIFTIYHWWQAVAIFVVYLGSSLPMKVRCRDPSCYLHSTGVCKAPPGHEALALIPALMGCPRHAPRLWEQGSGTLISTTWGSV